MEASSQPLLSGQPAWRASHRPDSGWKITAGVVNHQSARTTSRATSACAALWRPRLAKNI